MPIVVHCPCGKQLRARDEQAGRRCKCPGCGRMIEVPPPLAAMAPPEYAPPEYAPPPYVPPAAAPIRAEPVIDATYVPPAAWRPPVESAPEPPELPKSSADIDKLEKTWRAHVYWLLLIGILPLIYSTFAQQPDFDAIVTKILQQHPELTPKEEEPFDDEDIQVLTPTTQKASLEDVQELLPALPGKKIEGALLAHDTWMHWPIALVAAVVLLGFTAVAIPADCCSHGKLFGAALFTATLGVGMLIMVQFFGMFCCVGLWYIAALHPDAPFGPSLLGFVFGVGVCEETIKCIPILWRMHRDDDFGWRDACLIGMASGAGFGVSEGVHYCSSFYNGIFGADIYLVRFMSSAGLHIMLSAACGIMIFRKRKFLDWSDPFDSFLTLIAIMIVPIFLHGLFDTVLKMELDVLALFVWLACFAWLAWLINDSRKKENVVQVAVAAAPKLVRTEKGTRFVAP